MRLDWVTYSWSHVTYETVGDSRAQVQEAYASYSIYDTPCWNEPEGDYLWYCENEAGRGACVLFFFEGDTVSRIVLNNMFD